MANTTKGERGSTKQQQLDIDAILDGATAQLEGRFKAIQDELAPLREEERKVAEAIFRLVGSYPDGYRGPIATLSTATRSRAKTDGVRERLAPEEREAQVMQVVSERPGINGVGIARELGISAATAEKALKSLLEQDPPKLRVTGERRTRQIFLAEAPKA